MELSDEAIYNKVKDDLIRYATVLVGPTDAEDVVSTVILRTLQRRPLSDLDEPRPYLFRAVLNEARGLHRRRPVVRPPQSDVAMDDHADDSVMNALRGLPDRQRAAIYLVYWEDLTISDAADAMGARPGTVKRYLHLARKNLRGALQ